MMRAPSVLLLLCVVLLVSVSVLGGVASAQMAPLFRKVNSEISGSESTFVGDNEESDGPKDSLHFSQTPGTSDVFTMENKYYTDFEDTTTVASSVTVTLMELIQYEDPSNSGYQQGGATVSTLVPAASGVVQRSERTQDFEGVDGGEVTYLVMTTPYGDGPVLQTESAMSPITLTGDSGSFSGKTVSTNGVNNNLLVDMTESFAWASGDTVRLAMHVRVSSSLSVLDTGSDFVMFGSSSGVRHRISWENSARINDNSDVDVEFQLVPSASHYDIYFSIMADSQWDTLFWDPLIELDYADGENTLPGGSSGTGSSPDAAFRFSSDLFAVSFLIALLALIL